MELIEHFLDAPPVYFHAFRSTDFPENNTVVTENPVTITYESIRLSSGGGFNKDTGVFTAPVGGTYIFNFRGYTDGKNAVSTNPIIGIGVNGDFYIDIVKGGTGVESREDFVSCSAVVPLSKNDRVQVNLLKGKLSEMKTTLNSPYKSTQFSGSLLGRKFV